MIGRIVPFCVTGHILWYYMLGLLTNSVTIGVVTNRQEDTCTNYCNNSSCASMLRTPVYACQGLVSWVKAALNLETKELFLKLIECCNLHLAI